MEAIGTLFSVGMFYVSFLIGAIYVNKGIYTISIMMASIQLINKIVTPLYDGVAILNKYNGAIAIVDKLENSLMVENRQSWLTFDKINKISIKNNITLYEDYKDDCYNNVLKKSGVDSFIKNLKEKDNTILEENGENIKEMR